MLTVPQLKPGQTPYDPSTAVITNIIQSDLTSPVDTQTPDPAALLDHALVKDALTTLHQEDDLHFTELQNYTALQLYSLQADHQTFLNNQKNKFLNQFPASHLKHLFLTTTQSYFIWSARRVELLYHQKIASYRTEVIERQNTELLDRAIQTENAFDDVLQTTYRDMILFNLENLLDTLSPHDRTLRLDEASRVFYKKVIEKRLELDPTSLDPILNSPAVKRILPATDINQYRKTAQNALLHESWKQKAQSWLDNNLSSSEVKQSIAKATSSADERKEFQHIYTHLEYNQNRKKCLTLILNTFNVWNLVIENGARPESIPNWVSRVNPPLRDFILQELTRYNNAGGLPYDTDYHYILDFIKTFDLTTSMTTLSDELYFYSFIEKSGGIHSEAFSIVQRLILGSLENNDSRWIEDHLLADQTISTHMGEKPDIATINNLIQRFSIIRQTRIANRDGKQFDELEIRTLIYELMNSNSI